MSYSNSIPHIELRASRSFSVYVLLCLSLSLYVLECSHMPFSVFLGASLPFAVLLRFFSFTVFAAPLCHSRSISFSMHFFAPIHSISFSLHLFALIRSLPFRLHLHLSFSLFYFCFMSSLPSLLCPSPPSSALLCPSLCSMYSVAFIMCVLMFVLIQSH